MVNYSLVDSNFDLDDIQNKIVNKDKNDVYLTRYKMQLAASKEWSDLFNRIEDGLELFTIENDYYVYLKSSLFFLYQNNIIKKISERINKANDYYNANELKIAIILSTNNFVPGNIVVHLRNELSYSETKIYTNVSDINSPYYNQGGVNFYPDYKAFLLHRISDRIF